uniref:Uncharacterized protein n=1 Tax=Amphimedon queenslandica TaxID=400682 RepID=A0A1X7V0A0_AMPQE
MGCVCCKCCCGGETYDFADRSTSGVGGEWRVRGQHVVRLLAQVLELVSILGDNEDGVPLRTAPADDSSSDDSSKASEISDDEFNWVWNPICDCLVHVNVACLQEGEVYEYAVYAEEKELCPFSSNITIPGTDIKRTGPFFVQWKDIYTGKVYGLNFFTESEALRFVSSCFPPNFTPDTCIRHTSSRLTYICPPPPPAISQRPQGEQNRDHMRPNYGFDYLAMTSTPIPNVEEEGEMEAYFKLPTHRPVHAVSPTVNSAEIPSGVLPLPHSSSVLSDESFDGPNNGSPSSLPSPPSLFMMADKKMEETESTDNDTSNTSSVDHELFQPTEPLQVNKILEDIKEEEDEEEGSMKSSNTTDQLRDSSVEVPQVVLDKCLADFDDFLKDIRKSQLIEITEREARLSRQSSFTAGPPPLLPPTPPPGPTLSPKHNTNNPFLSPSFQSALKRMSSSSFDDIPAPTLHQQRSTEDTNRDSLPPPLARRDSEDFEMNRQNSLNNNYLQPPDAFSSDSGLPFSSDNELYSQADTENKRHHFIANAREADTSSQQSETTESAGIPNYTGTYPPEGAVAASMEWKKTDSIKKAGWLEVKGVLVRKNRKVAMKSTRRWKSHWAVLKGKYIFLHRWDQGPFGTNNETQLDMKIDISQSLAHPVHDHMKRDHLFCLSTCSGNTYYMQAVNQAAVDEWIHSVHSAAAFDFTDQLDREVSIKFLNTVILENEEALEKEKQMKNLAELQSTTVTDNASRSKINKQIAIFNENIENYQMIIYRNRCYLASLQCTELPNPQPLLSSVSKSTKMNLTKVGNFSVASLHAVVNVRLSTAKSSTGASAMQSPTLSPASTIATSTEKKKKRHFTFFGRKGDSKAKRKLFSSPNISEPLPGTVGSQLLTYRQLLEPNPLATGFGATLMITILQDKVCAVPFRLDLTVDDILLTCCKKFGLDPADHFLKLTTPEGEEQVPHEDEFIVNLAFNNLEVAQKFIITVQFDTSPDNIGLTLQPDLRNLGSVTHVIIESVAPNSEAQRLGLSKGDEVVLIDDQTVAHMSWNEVLSAVEESNFTLTVRTRHYKAPVGVAGRTTLLHLNDLVCPSPPTQEKKMKLDDLIVPLPSTEDLHKLGGSSGSLTASESEDNLEPDEDRVLQLIKGSLEVTGLLDRWKAYEEAETQETDDEVPSPPMSPQQKMFKCVREIVESEKEHVKALDLLVDRYLEPMKYELFLPRDKISFIYDSVLSVVIQQKQFFGRIEELPDKSPDDPENVKILVKELSDAFMNHLDTFRQYSQFCAAQHELEYILINVTNRQEMEEFLEVRNPKQSPSLTLTALLIKPVLRLLRYPLFLQALKDMSDKDSEEHQILKDTLTSVSMVTEYINEVKRVTESYANVFDTILEVSGLVEFGISVRVSELLSHMTVMWLNAPGTMGRGWRKGQGPEMQCFGKNQVNQSPCIIYTLFSVQQ